MKKRKVLYISGTRGDYGLMRHTLRCIKESPNLDIEIVAAGMHLMAEFGNTVTEIEKDKFRLHRMQIVFSQDNKESMSIFLGRFVQALTVKISEIKPDVILLLGDRAEMLGGAIVGVYLTIPIVHIHGGEVTSTVDELARHAITKLSHLHLVATQRSRQRIISMGEEPWRVRVVGAPGLDSIKHEEVIPKKELYKRFHLRLTEPFLILIQHPNTFELTEVRKQIIETMEAINSLKYQTIVIYPNADAGGRQIIREIEKYRHLPFIRTFKSLPYRDYVNLLRNASALVGNSSSGIIEAPYFKLPAINIGTRQDGRERAENIIDVPYRRNKIITAIRKALCDEAFNERVRRCQNPYGQGRAGGKIANILRRIKLDQKLLQKRIIYREGIMKERFKNWEFPRIEESKLTKYKWFVQHKKKLKLGYKTDIGAFTYINAKNGVVIEDYVQIGSHCAIYSVSTVDNKAGEVVLKRNARIGSHSVIMPGVTIGENSIVGAFSFVNRNIPRNCLAFGVPVKILRKRTAKEIGTDG